MGGIWHINPDTMMKNPVFSQIVTTEGKGKTIYIGGQNSVNANRAVIGKDDINVQTKQVMENIQSALQSCGGTFENLVKLNIHIVQGQNAAAAFQASQQYLGSASAPPVITVIFVCSLVNPDFLIEIDAVAFVPDE
jgi:enamine deaminase RidA (YjgF/YER057c/UK114 family)